jgi:hypothetical protein
VLTRDEVLNAEIPSGDYSHAMSEMQSALDFLLNFDNVAPDKEILDEKAKSFCMAFELLAYANKNKMKVGELGDFLSNSQKSEDRSGQCKSDD